MSPDRTPSPGATSSPASTSSASPAPMPRLSSPSHPTRRLSTHGGGSSHKSPASGQGGTSSQVAAAAAAAGAALLLVALLVACCCCWCRKKRKAAQPPKGMMFYMDSSGFKGNSSGYYYPPGGARPQWQNQVAPGPPAPAAASTGSTGAQGGGGVLLPPPPPLPMPAGLDTAAFSYEELAAATGGFSEANLLGQGGFGYVHRGVLPGSGKEVAVKQLKAGSGQGEREFQAEVDTISRVHHRHLVALVGYCIDGARRLLVYEFVPNDTLEHHLHGKGRPVMEWTVRLRIALGAAKGLAYLHEECNPRIIHRDIKSANILLDNNFEAMVADFGLAKLTNVNHTHVSTRVMGTFGYLAPEYASSGKLTEKSDVFSYGVMLLELLTGRRPGDRSSYGQDGLVDWARQALPRALGDGNYDELVDPRLRGDGGRAPRRLRRRRRPPRRAPPPQDEPDRHGAAGGDAAGGPRRRRAPRARRNVQLRIRLRLGVGVRVRVRVLHGADGEDPEGGAAQPRVQRRLPRLHPGVRPPVAGKQRRLRRAG